MRYGELKTAVDALGGNHTELSEAYPNLANSGDPKFCSIITRAMSEINLIRPRISEAQIFCRAPRTLYAFSEPRSVEGYMDIPLLGGKAVTFEYRGDGTMESVDHQTYTMSSPYEFKHMAMIISEQQSHERLRFSSKNMFTLRNVAVYAERISNRIEDVPVYSDRISYAVERDDFVALSPDSISLEDQKRYDVKIHDNRYISVPWSTTATIKARYRRKIKAVTVDTSDIEELDLDEDLARALLPSLVASYAFFDPTDSASVYFRQIYENDRAMLVSKIHNADASRIYITNNW